MNHKTPRNFAKQAGNMLHYWLLITVSWISSARLQEVDVGEQRTDGILDPLDPGLNYPLPFLTNFYNLAPSGNELDSQSSNSEGEDQPPSIPRPRRKIDNARESRLTWVPNLIDTEGALYVQNSDRLGGDPDPSILMQQYGNNIPNNNDTTSTVVDATEKQYITEPVVKKIFNPWGGKRSNKLDHNMWTWKRHSNIREPSMPKRRFNPWGGKRSGQLIYKPGSKGSKIIFSNTVPELNRIISSYGSGTERYNLAGFHLIPALDKRQPVRVLTIGTKLEDKSPDFLPFQAFIESSKQFKLGHPYLDVNLKKDGKRKVKFSAWGGKRSPPIIGPIWTPQEHDWIDPK